MSYIPNIGSQVTGDGTDYTLTTTLARVDFGTTDPEVILPTPGTYIVFALGLYGADAAGATDICLLRLRNSTDSVFVGALNDGMGAITFGLDSIFVSCVLTITESKTIQLWAVNSSAARGTLLASGTQISFIRISY